MNLLLLILVATELNRQNFHLELYDTSTFFGSHNTAHLISLVRRAHMSTPEMPEVLVEKDEMTVDGLAVDWIHGNIYYTDISANKIQMISWDGRWTRTIITDKLDLPRAIAVNPVDG